MDATTVVTSNGSKQAPAASAGLRRVFSTLSSVAPGVASWAAERMWFTPPRPPVSETARAALAKGTVLPIAVDGRRVAAWKFGEGRAIVLMHGWGGHSGQLLPFIEPLVGAGFCVVAFDALAHGASAASRAGVRLSTFYDFAAGLAAIQDQVGPLQGLVAHSGGAIAAGIALRRRLEVERLVLLAPMTRPRNYAALFSSALALDSKVNDAWQARALKRINASWEDLDLTLLAGARRPALIVHDREDREVPFADGEALALAWPGATLYPVLGLGHRRILRDAEVISRSVAYLST